MDDVIADAPEDVEAVIESLFTVAPGQFVAARNEAAKTLRRQKRRQDADRVAALTRPTATAWALNNVARSSPELVGVLLASGAQMRQVQEAVLAGRSGPELLRAASDERRAAVRALIDAASLPAGGRAEELVRTLEAASVDAELGHLLRRGRFSTVVLDAVGFDGSLVPPTVSDVPRRHLHLVPPLATSESIEADAATERFRAEHERLEHERARAELVQRCIAQESAAIVTCDEASVTLLRAQEHRDGVATELDAVRREVERLQALARDADEAVQQSVAAHDAAVDHLAVAVALREEAEIELAAHDQNDQLH